MGLAVTQDASRARPVAVLFAPRLVPLVDVFRGLAGFGESYDVAVLDRLEARLAGTIGARAARGVVSDALLLAFSLRRAGLGSLAYAARGSRAGTLDEYRLLALIGAAYWRDFTLAAQAAAVLRVDHPQPLIASACDIAGRLARVGFALPAPDARLLGPDAAEGRDACAVNVLRPVADASAREG